MLTAELFLESSDHHHSFLYLFFYSTRSYGKPIICQVLRLEGAQGTLDSSVESGRGQAGAKTVKDFVLPMSKCFNVVINDTYFILK